MAITTVASDKHLWNTTANGFTAATSPLSISMWIRGTWNSGTVSMVGLYGPAGTPTTAIQIGSRGNGFVSCWTWGGGILVTGSATLANNTWYHIAYTYDGVTHRIYVNGVLSNTSTTSQLNGQLAYVYINGYPTGAAAETSVYSVDMCSYYDRTLSAGEIVTQYTLGGARHGVVDGLIACYEFDELSDGSVVTQVTDLSGNQNHLTVTGAGTGNFIYSSATGVAGSNLRMVQ